MAQSAGRPGTLPYSMTSFVDRRTETAELTDRLAGTRLVVITGVAGVGKSRLALHLADRSGRAFPDGRWWVELGGVRDPALLPHTVANALLAQDLTGRDPMAALTEFLSDRRVLVVLDGCEHLVDACAALVDRLLRSTSGVRFLVTGRQALTVADGQVYSLEPLPTPAGDEPSGGTEPGGWHVVQLFTDRAAAHGFTVTPDSRPYVVEICRRLEGVPLAIELAATLPRVLSVRQIADRLEDRFRLLSAARLRGPARHRSLQAALDWSYDLCSAAERTVWTRASVFRGGFDLGSAQELCASPDVDPAMVARLVEGLAAKSIITVAERGGRRRYRMLDTIREYGRQRLLTGGTLPALERAHADLFARRAELAEQQWFGPRQESWFEWLHDEHDNLRAALETLADTAPEAALRLAATLWFHWVFSGRVAEGRLWLRRVLALPAAPSAARAAALWTCSLVASQQGDLEETVTLATAAREMAGQVGDELTVARSVARLAIVSNYRGDSAAVEALQAEAQDRYAALGVADGPYAVMGRLTEAAARLHRGDLAAVDLAIRCAADCRARGDRILLANSLTFVAQGQWRSGELGAAAGHVREALRLRRERTAALNLAQLVELLAWITAAGGEAERAAVLLGAADRVWSDYGLRQNRQSPYYNKPHEEAGQRCRAALGEARYAQAFERGNAMTPDQIVPHALDEKQPGTTRASASLTPRERQVIALIAKGLTNREIATELVVSPRTVETHVQNSLRKLALTSRAEIAAWANS